ncbi:penicillin-binding protein 2 [Schaalia sp. 19OD2882]|uniref:peptidoglycan D,D-transpeptidase FtsI family protein n=1 Tax=Schaalia sp. 19OD2882 TaxID=2794089 RepID=UPI001C1EF2F8|nr:penicillin-binding protein 2 [Schaalia sp. 19OD2882]QWW18945.1 penicillin-binding protein 2 [Schaalia sp. 19OD2882]
MTSVARRSRAIALLALAALSLLGVRLVVVQLIQGESLAAEGQKVRTQVSEVTPRRGSITDATGVVLADSVQAYHVAVNQVNIPAWVHYQVVDGEVTDTVLGTGAAEAAKLLAPLLEMNEAELGGMLIGTSTYRYLKKNVDPVTFRKIRALDIHGIEWESVYERTYPNGNTAAPIVGTINPEGHGQGLEAVYNDLLKGTPGEEAFEIAPNGAIIPGGKRTTVEPTNGATLRTTLHADLQHLVQTKLDERVAKHKADWGTVVVTEVSTGRVLVMADSGSTAPDPAKVQPVAGVQYAFEPGSVGKVVTVATALEKRVITPTSVFTVPYSLSPPDAGGPITDFHEHPTVPMTATGILAESSNTGTMLIAEKVTDEERRDLMLKFGFGAPTGIELPGEASGTVRPADQWVGRDRYVTMFGQAYTVNALQEATLMATIGNGGVRLDPRIIDSWTLPDGTVHKSDPIEPVQVLRSDTASQLLRMMESVVQDESGTGTPAKVDGYRLALKTGTADIFVDGVPGVVSTTAGVVPAEAPRLAVAVVLYNPKVGVLSSESAAPLFGEVATEAVRNLGVPASAEDPELYPTTP